MEKHAYVVNECIKDAELQRALQNLPTAEPYQERKGYGCKHLHGGTEQAVCHDLAHNRPVVFPACFIEPVVILLFPVEHLDDPHSRNVLRCSGIDLCQCCPYIPVHLPYLSPEKHRQYHHDRHYCKGDQRHGHVQPEHDQNDTCQYGEILHQRDEHIGIHLIQRLRIICHAGHEPSDRIFVKI